MCSALEGALAGRLARGVASCTSVGPELSARWEVFEGGHPLPNASSEEAARAAFRLLAEADRREAIVIFLVSGGGSAMLEMPRGEGVTLEDLREVNRALVTCGAPISEVNAVRRAVSAVKGGGLSRAAPRSAQVTLLVSDVNAGREADVASGPTFEAESGGGAAARVVGRYGLAARLAPAVLRALRHAPARESGGEARAPRSHFVLLDNGSAVEAAARAARARGFVTEVATDLVEQHVAEGSAALVARLLDLAGREGSRGGVCLVSGGEFACPVRGAGVGGRNAETALRCAFEFERVCGGGAAGGRVLVALSAGTDGIDGNSPAAGALADRTTLARARARGLDPRTHLEESDAYSLFHALGDAVVTGPTGTNVRDVRVLLAA